MRIKDRYRVYTCFICKVQRDSSFIEEYTRICKECYIENNTLSEETLEKLNLDLNKVLGIWRAGYLIDYEFFKLLKFIERQKTLKLKPYKVIYLFYKVFGTRHFRNFSS